MRVYNIYYSPTGGTKKVSDILFGAIGKNTCEIDLFKNNMPGQHFAMDDVCIISVPAFGGRVPGDAAKKIKAFKSNGSLAIIVAVFGNRAIDDTLTELYDIVTNVGFKVIAGVEAVAEHSLVRRYGAERPNENDKMELCQFAKIICQKLEKEDLTAPKIPGNRPYRDFKLSAMSLVVDESCINCKKCAEECPVDAIPMDNIKTVDENKCFSCMHCVSTCPINARHNSPTVTVALEERLSEACAGIKPNKLYI